MEVSGKCSSPIYLSSLPTEVISHILSYLSVEDRVNVASAVPTWQYSLHCPSSWKHVNINVGNCLPNQFVVYSTAIKIYGKHFQNLVLSCSTADFANFYLQCLIEIHKHCITLKSLKVFHPKLFKFSDTSQFQEYCRWLRIIAKNNKQLRKCSLCFNEYIPVLRDIGFGEILKEVVSSQSALANIVDNIEFTHEYPMVKKFPFVASFINLQKLRCQIQNLNTELILSLLIKTQLANLIVINDVFTQEANWNEDNCIDWKHIQEQLPHRELNVHYHIKGRNWHADDFVINPFIHSLVIDCYPVSSFLDIVEMSSTYSESLQVFMLLTSEGQNPLAEFDDELCFAPAVYGALVHTCPLLHTFISTVSIPASAVLTIAANKKLQNIWIPEGAILYTTEDLPRSSLWSLDEDVKVDWWKKIVKDRESLVNIVSKFLGWSWMPQIASAMQAKVNTVLDIM